MYSHWEWNPWLGKKEEVYKWKDAPGNCDGKTVDSVVIAGDFTPHYRATKGERRMGTSKAS